MSRVELGPAAALGGLSLEEVSRIFAASAKHLELFDETHLQRFFAIGPIDAGVYVVVHGERDAGAVTVLSARTAAPHEAAAYLRQLRKAGP